MAKEVLCSVDCPHVFMGDFNFDYAWSSERDNIDWEIYTDLWGDLRDEKEESWTMPGSAKYSSVVFDHIVLRKEQGWEPGFVQRVGNFCIPKYLKIQERPE